MRARLFVLAGPEIGRSFELRHGDTLGRSPDCIITLRHPSVSRRHAHLEVRDDEFWVVDDASRNGVFGPDGRVEELRLSDHMEFALGELSLRFRVETAGRDATPSGGAATARTAQPTVPPHHPGTAAPPAGDAPSAASSPADPAPSAPTLDARPPATPEPDDGGITLEAPEDIELAPAAPAPARPASDARPERSSGERVLQYHRVPNTRGFAVADLAQQPTWVRWTLYLVGLAVAVGLFLAAFKGTAFLKGRAAPPADAELGD